MTTTTALDLAYLSISEAGSLFRKKELSPVELTEAHLSRIEQINPSVRAFITVTADLALQNAKEAEAAIQKGDTRPLLGIPMAHKDIVLTEGILTTGGSAVYADYVPDFTATIINKLHDEAGAVLLGKLSTHEFAFAMSTEDHPFPPARNPWNLGHIPGGSSSGSGAGIAAGMMMSAIGTDTGGSIRGPGSLCGIAALKPTYGRCSRYGVFSLSWSLDHTGPMARTTEDAALMLQAMAGYDPKDPASAATPVGDYTADLKAGVKGLKIGVLRSWFEPGTEPAALAAVNAAIDTLKELGATIVDIEIPSVDFVPCQRIIMLAEAYAYHAATIKATPELYPTWLRDRFQIGGLFSAEEYINAQRARQVLTSDTLKLMKDVDVMLSPTRGGSALTFEDAYIDYFSQASYTSLGNMTGQPALTIPCGFDDKSLPFGLQIMGRPFDEATVLRVGHAYEQAAGWYKRHPDL